MKIALVAGSLIAASMLVKNIGTKTIQASGGTVTGLAFLALPYLTPAPLKRLVTTA